MIAGIACRVATSWSEMSEASAAYGVALRYPTVTKLRQGSISEGSSANGTTYSRAQDGLDSRSIFQRLNRLLTVGFVNNISAE